MTPEGGTDTQAALDALFAAVAAEPWAHDFFMLLRRVDALRPDAPPTGEAQRPAQEALRLGQPPDMDFAAAALAGLERRPGGPPRLAVRFFGLLGPQGAMPLHFTEYVRERLLHHKDATLAHFLDLFHHRLLTLFYRSWAQAQAVVHLDRPGQDRYGAWLGAISGQTWVAGAPTPGARASQAGLLAGRSRHPEALCKALREYLGVPVALEPNVGHWLSVDRRDRSRLGFAANRAERAQVQAAAVGATACAGSRVWDRQYRFRLQLGPLTHAQYQSFLPGSSAWKALVGWVRLLAGDELNWELQLVLSPAERPPPRVDGSVRLGVTSWLPGGAAELRALRIRPATCFLLKGA